MREMNVHSMRLLVADRVQGKPVVLEIASVSDQMPEKVEWIFACSQKERAYLHQVFQGKVSTWRFESAGGNYELYYPVKTRKRIIVLYFTDYQRYGKLGS